MSAAVVMDPVIERARRPARRRVDALLEELGKLLEAKPVDKSMVSGAWDAVEMEYEALKLLDQQAREFLLNADAAEEVEDKEFREANGYFLKFRAMHFRVNSLFEA